MLETDNGRVDLRAVIGPDYGRIYDHELVDPSFNAPIYANLFGDEEGDTFSLIWSRPNGRRGD